MPPMSFSTFLTQIADALRRENGAELAYLLKPVEEHGKSIVKEFRNPTKQSLSYYEGSMESPWDEIAIQYVLVVNHCAKNRATEAFKEECALASLFFRYFANNSGWTLPALFSILRDLRDLAFDADLEARSKGQGGTANMEEAARVLSKAFTNCVTDRQSPYAESRKWGVYYVVGLILKCYFRVKRISLSKNILRAIEANPDIPPLSAYPRSHQVTYRYYIGMLSFLNEDFAKSEQELTLAFYNCHLEAHGNQQRVLTYLIPLRILRGHLPTRELLDRFPVLDDLYSPFIVAMKTGNIRSYDELLEKFERRLANLNLYLTMERAREIVIRGLFRRVWVMSEKSTRIPISMFHVALQFAGSTDTPVEEAECLVANMIYKGYMKGYISHEKQTVVLSAKNAFPRLCDRVQPYAIV
ncbi:PCI domain-containing protein [Abortiporus biennis]|nr:PCI domain-containing protein [Abortiporus biennis]